MRSTHPGRSLGAAVLAGAVVVTACQSAQVEPSGPQFTIGLVTNNPNGMRNVAGFIEGMEELGYVEGENVTYLFASEPVKGDDLDRELSEFVDGGVDLIFTAGTPTGIAAHRATEGTRIPVVFGVIADPIGAGVMTDLSRPGGNLTGVKTVQDQGRRLELLREIAPDSQRVLVPYNPDDPAATGAIDQIMALAPELGVELVLRQARSPGEVQGLLGNIPAEVDALFLVPDSVVNAHLDQILEVADQLRLPTSGPSTAQVEEGALMAFGFVHRAAGAQAAHIADRVLRGGNPAEIPVEDTESYLAINLITAESIGLSISDEILRQAEVVVRAEGQ